MKTLAELLGLDDVPIKLIRTNYGRVVKPEERRGIGAHYDGSKTDKGAENWFQSPEFKLSYQKAYTDHGRRIGLAGVEYRAYHMGLCRTTTQVRDANSAFYGLCVTATSGQPRHPDTGAVVTPAQFAAIVRDAAIIARWHQLLGHKWWDTDLVDTWCTGHNEWAIHPSKLPNGQPHPLAGQLGRKPDPKGYEEEYDVLPINSMRQSVATLLDSPAHDVWERFK